MTLNVSLSRTLYAYFSMLCAFTSWSEHVFTNFCYELFFTKFHGFLLKGCILSFLLKDHPFNMSAFFRDGGGQKFAKWIVAKKLSTVGGSQKLWTFSDVIKIVYLLDIFWLFWSQLKFFSGEKPGFVKTCDDWWAC